MEGFKRAYDQYFSIKPSAFLMLTDQPGRQISGGAVVPIELPTVDPAATDFFRLKSTSFRIKKLSYILDVDDGDLLDDPQQRDFHFQVCLFVDHRAGSSIVDKENDAPKFWEMLACANRSGLYIYDADLHPQTNIRYQDRFDLIAEHHIEIPPQWNFNSNLPAALRAHEWDYNNELWQGQLPWDSSIYQPRPGFPGPWTHPSNPDPRTPYVQGDGADMTRVHRWGQETIQIGRFNTTANSVDQSETSPPDGYLNVDNKYWERGFGNSAGIWGVQFDLYPPAAPIHGVVPQRPVTQWNNAFGGFIAIGHKGGESTEFAQQTHRQVKAREGARCLRTNNATYLNDVAIRIDDRVTNMISRSVDLSDITFLEFIDYEPVPGFEPTAIASYNKRLYLTFWSQAEGVNPDFIPRVNVKIRVEFEAI